MCLSARFNICMCVYVSVNVYPSIVVSRICRNHGRRHNDRDSRNTHNVYGTHSLYTLRIHREPRKTRPLYIVFLLTNGLAVASFLRFGLSFLTHTHKPRHTPKKNMRAPLLSFSAVCGHYKHLNEAKSRCLYFFTRDLTHFTHWQFRFSRHAHTHVHTRAVLGHAHASTQAHIYMDMLDIWGAGGRGGGSDGVVLA